MTRAKTSAVGSVGVTQICGEKKCERAGKPLPLSEYPVNRKRKNGRYLYCKECCQRKVKAYRADRKLYAPPTKKASVVDEPVLIFRPKPPSDLEKVRTAIAEGYHDRDSIAAYTGLLADIVGDKLAELYTELLVERNGTGRKFYLRNGATNGKNERSLVAV